MVTVLSVNSWKALLLDVNLLCNTPEKKPLCTASHIVKMTSLKLILILTDNYNTYLKMYHS